MDNTVINICRKLAVGNPGAIIVLGKLIKIDTKYIYMIIKKIFRLFT